jgi:hypothetical protein
VRAMTAYVEDNLPGVKIAEPRSSRLNRCVVEGRSAGVGHQT